jgi:hypothetical protein
MEQSDTAIEDEERADMATNLGVKVIRPTEAVLTVQTDIRSAPAILDFTEYPDGSGVDYNLPHTD